MYKNSKGTWLYVFKKYKIFFTDIYYKCGAADSIWAAVWITDCCLACGRTHFTNLIVYRSLLHVDDCMHSAYFGDRWREILLQDFELLEKSDIDLQFRRFAWGKGYGWLFFFFLLSFLTWSARNHKWVTDWYFLAIGADQVLIALCLSAALASLLQCKRNGKERVLTDHLYILF